jgi:hypothetical protein
MNLARRGDVVRAPLWRKGSRGDFRRTVTEWMPPGTHETILAEVDDVLVLRDVGKRVLYVALQAEQLSAENSGAERYLEHVGVNISPGNFMLRLGICEFDGYLEEEALDQVFNSSPEQLEFDALDIKVIQIPVS